ncbi:MAG: 2-oxo-4-hydroxy-4-carboxy-5-ureidoimidazoline decarboxylase [Planctomycetota bacterium]
MAISLRRIKADVEAIARCTATPGEGATRPTFSEAWAEARAYAIEQATAAGAEVRIDAAGNLHARAAELGWEAPAWLVGSHLDSVPNGGDYDGVIGVVLGLELLRSAREDGLDALPVEVIDFAEEEGPTFGLGMLGSRAWVGELDAEALAVLRNADGLSYLEAGAPHGVRPGDLPSERLDPSRYLGMIELHAEQGPGLWRRDHRLGVVRAIAGRGQYQLTVTGEPNHAGATAMADRRDALAAAAEMVVALESLAAELSPETVVTVGRLNPEPNAVNVIAGRVSFTIDLRAPEDSLLEGGDGLVGRRLNEIAERRGLTVAIDRTESIPARPMDDRLAGALRGVALGSYDEVPVVVSGALHDAAVVAPYVPTAMLFIPSRDGVSHNPAEFSRVEDVASAAAVVERLVRRPTLDRLSAMDRESFLAVGGGAFEHSPWVFERAWGHRPFVDLDGLMAACRRVLDDATEAERLGLIRAHPDLVGRLARSGGLTDDSTAEQAAAGLDDVTPEEASQFEAYNAAYREKFNFPFVICAREHRKDAILRAMPVRLQDDLATEMAAALNEIAKIARLRLADRLWET